MFIKSTRATKAPIIKVSVDRSCDHCIDVRFDEFHFISLTKEEADELQTMLSQALQDLEEVDNET